MDIRDIQTHLTNLLSHSDEYLREEVKTLVLKLDEIIKEENNNINSGRASALIDSYKAKHETLARQFNQIPTDKKHALDRLYKAQEVIVAIDTVMYYIKWALSRCTRQTADSKVVLMLRSDEEYFKEASFRWCQILSSMNSELKLRTSILQSKHDLGKEDGTR